MNELEELILYWKDRLCYLPRNAKTTDREAIRNTIKYLEELNALKGD